MPKSTFLLVLIGWFLTGASQAQDIIFKTSGDEINAKITEITPTDIWYKKPDSLDGRTFSLPKQEVFMLKYANGAKELMQPYVRPDTSATETRTSLQLYELGRRDALRYYRGNGALLGAAGSTLAIGLLGPIIIGAIPPRIKVGEVSDPLLLAQPSYVSGYRAQAHRRKIGKVATGGGIAILSITLLFLSAISGM